MSIAIDSRCLLCHFQQSIDLARRSGSEEQAMAFAKELMRMYLDAPEGTTSLSFAPRTAQLLHDHYGIPLDRFKQEKADSNRFVMDRFPLLKERVDTAADPVLAGLQFSILGNYLDFSALRGQVSFDTLSEMMDKALEMEFDRAVFDSLCQDLSAGKSLLYITDNAGEIGFDRIFAEAIAARYPQLSITFCVRGGIAQNDATREDAAIVGIPFRVIDNGNCIPGTQLDMLSQEAAQAIETADVILAKGMANVETMLGCGHNIYYAFLIKCRRFEELFSAPMFTPMLVKERA